MTNRDSGETEKPGRRQENVSALTSGNILLGLERVGMDGDGLEATGNSRPIPLKNY
jgi:hypothetical protein